VTVTRASAAKAKPAAAAPRARAAPAAPVKPAGNGAALDVGAMQHLMGYRLTLAEVASRRVFQRHIGGPLQLRPVEFTILALLHTNAQATPKQLALALAMPPPNVTVLVDRLVERSLVQRQRSATDGRATNLQLTDAGRELAKRALRVSQGMEAGLLAALSAAERAMLGELLIKLTQGAQALDT
jgi:DNA-binding MarR family transcriptional regulator